MTATTTWLFHRQFTIALPSAFPPIPPPPQLARTPWSPCYVLSSTLVYSICQLTPFILVKYHTTPAAWGLGRQLELLWGPTCLESQHFYTVPTTQNSEWAPAFNWFILIDTGTLVKQSRPNYCCCVLQLPNDWQQLWFFFWFFCFFLVFFFTLHSLFQQHPTFAIGSRTCSSTELILNPRNVNGTFYFSFARSANVFQL